MRHDNTHVYCERDAANDVYGQEYLISLKICTSEVQFHSLVESGGALRMTGYDNSNLDFTQSDGKVGKSPDKC